MYFTKYISSFLLVGLLAALSICGAQLEKAISLQSIDHVERDLAQFSLDDSDLVGIAKTGSIPHPHGKSKKCAKKELRGLSRLSRREDYLVVEGEYRVGTAADSLHTYQLKTCVGVAAVSNNGKKVLAHINAIDPTSNQDYVAQINAFLAAVHGLGGVIKIYASFPDYSAAGDDKKRQDALVAMVGHIDNAMTTFQDPYDAVDRPESLNAVGGTMAVSVAGVVTIDGCVQ